jgi:hypothetical protein
MASLRTTTHRNPASPEAQVRSGWLTAVPILAGVLLAAGAALKGYQLATESAKDTSASHTLRILGVELEAVLALWLLSGWRARLSRTAAIAVFLLFTCVSGYHAVAGHASCACFGKLETNPWLTLALDVLILCMLGIWTPEHPGRRARSHLALPVLVGFLLLVVTTGISLAVINHTGSQSLLTATPSSIDLGTLSPGSSKAARFSLRNPRTASIHVARIQTSCPCVTVQLQPPVLAPGESSTGTLLIDLRAEPAFTGRLAGRVEAFTESDELAFDLLVYLTVSRLE